MSNLIGQSLGRYHILEQLGEGGMATVYKAYDTRLECEVAIKVIRADKLSNEKVGKSFKRFEREAKTLARLSHPNIVKVTDYGEFKGNPYLVMEYVPGGTLKRKLGKPIPWREAARMLVPIAHALEYAHQNHIIHRDIKPGNILIAEIGRPMLSDFGIAKILDIEETGELTASGVGVGTPEYMAPEQFQGRVDTRSDIYALGVVFYEMLTGRRPYQADTPAAVIIKQATEPLPSPCQFVTGLPEGVEQALLKVLSKDPNNRYQSMGEFAANLEKIAAGDVSGIPQPRLRRRWLPVLLGGLAVLALAAISFLPPLLKGPAAAPTGAGTSAITRVYTPTPRNTLTPSLTPTTDPLMAGTLLSFCTTSAGQDICTSNYLGGYQQPLGLATEYKTLRGVSWSPDGERFTFAACLASEVGPLPSWDDACLHIFVANRDGSHVQDILRIGNTYTYNPVWSPDGSLIAFHYSCGLGLVSPDGSGRRMLKESDGNWCLTYQAWSPDSQTIAMLVSIRDATSGETFLPLQMFVVNRDGTNLQLLFQSNSELDETTLAWSPDGKWIAVRSGPTSYMIDAFCYERTGGCTASSDSYHTIQRIPPDWYPTYNPQWITNVNTILP